MNPTDMIAGQVEWVANNLAYNLDFIPQDKLDWKPAPTANSAIEIVNHIANTFKQIGGRLQGDAQKPEFSPATNLQEAKNLLRESAREYAQTLRGLSSEEINRDVEMPFGKMPALRVAGIGLVDLTHHHGQIAYIQTLLGDTEPHFDPAGF